MESLSDAEARSLRKLSSTRLRGKLLGNLTLIGVTADEVAEMSREALLECMATLYTLLKEQVEDPLSTLEDEGESGVEQVKVAPPNVDAATQLETVKLQLQLQRERQQHEREMQDRDLEMKDRELEMRRREAASAEQLKRDELEIKRLKITEQNKREQQQIILLKRYAEALKGVLHPQPADPCGLPLYFDNLERLYKQFEVPVKLQASLLIPYLNTRTQMMITRLPAGDLESYSKLKEFILTQHKLSSKDYRQRFSQAMRNPNETNVAYVSRLSTLQDYWLRSKEVTTFDQLRDLHVLEKLHDTLHPVVLRHVLTVEADKNVSAMRAAQVADIFEGNLPSDSKLRYQIEHFEPDSVHKNKGRKPDGRKHQESAPEGGSEKNGPQTKTDKNDIHQKDENKAEKKRRDLSKLPHFGKKGVCWSCGEPKNVNSGCKSPFHTRTVAVNSGTVEPLSVSDTDLFENPTVCLVDVALHNAYNVTPTESFESLKPSDVIKSETHADTLHGALVDTNSTESIQPSELIDVYHPHPTNTTTVFDDLSDTFLAAVPSDLGQSDTVVGKVVDLSRTLNNSVDIKPLNYVRIQLQGHNQPYSCLSDSGCMIPIIKQSVLETGSTSCMSSVDNLGPVKLRSAFGQSVLAHLVRIDVRLDCDALEAPFLPVTFAVVKDLTEDVILPAATVKELSEYSKMSEINTVDVDTSVSDNMSGRCLDQDSNNENNAHDETHGQTDDRPTDDTVQDTSQDSIDSESIDTLPFAVTDQSKLMELISEQQSDHTLANCLHQAKVGKGNYFFKSGVLFHREKIADQWVEQLMLPQTRRKQVMHFAHRTLTGGHCRAQRTRARIKLHFTWPGIRKDVLNFVSQCKDCSLRIGLRRSDHVPITPIVRPTLPFVVAHADIIGPLDPPSSAGHKYCLTVVDACTRWCWCYPLRTVTSQAVCDCFLDLFQNTGVFKVIVMDNGSNFCSVLTTEFLRRLGVAPRFVAPYHAEANGLVERFNSSFKTMLHFAMREFGRGWHKAVPLLYGCFVNLQTQLLVCHRFCYNMVCIHMECYRC